MAEISITPKRSTKSIPNICDKVKSDMRERKRNILYLIQSFLMEQRLYGAAEALEKEAQLCTQYQVCENIDLDIILQEYQSYYYTKFQRYPKIVRKIPEDAPMLKQPNRQSSAKQKRSEFKIKHETQSDSEDFQFEIISLTNNKDNKDPAVLASDQVIINNSDTQSIEWKELADKIRRDFMPKNLNLSWSDCIGLSDIAEKLKEATLYPTLYPKLFENVASWRGIMLFGPPGTGKTLLAKALAAEGFTFINVSSSTFVSKWRGESEKMLKVLFDLAKIHAPSTIFIDELDALVSSTYQHEASNRFKSELLTLIDGIQGMDRSIFVLGSTNAPWNLGTALLRRFEKRILVPLPDISKRIDLLRYYLPQTNSLNDIELAKVAQMMKNFSGSDIKTICKEVQMCVIREKIKDMGGNLNTSTDSRLRQIIYKDIEQCLERFKLCITIEEIRKFEEWNKFHGSW